MQRGGPRASLRLTMHMTNYKLRIPRPGSATFQSPIFWHFPVTKDRLAKGWRGYFFFNHMMRVREKVTENTVRGAFNRGAAILIPVDQVGANILIPIFVSENEMSWFLIQVKNRKDDTMSDERKREAKLALQLAAMNLPNGNRAHLGMMMCLQSTETGVDEVVHPMLMQCDTAAETESEYEWDMKRVVLLSCGLSADLFPGLACSEAGECVGVLRDMLDYTADGVEATTY